MSELKLPSILKHKCSLAHTGIFEQFACSWNHKSWGLISLLGFFGVWLMYCQFTSTLVLCHLEVKIVNAPSLCRKYLLWDHGKSCVKKGELIVMMWLMSCSLSARWSVTSKTQTVPAINWLIRSLPKVNGWPAVSVAGVVMWLTLVSMLTAFLRFATLSGRLFWPDHIYYILYCTALCVTVIDAVVFVAGVWFWLIVWVSQFLFVSLLLPLSIDCISACVFNIYNPSSFTWETKSLLFNSLELKGVAGLKL